MCSGPVEQLSPMTSTRQRLERRHRARDVGAEQHAAARVERDLRLDRTRRPISANSRSKPAIAAFTSRMSCAVSTSRTSTPPSTRYFACS